MYVCRGFGSNNADSISFRYHLKDVSVKSQILTGMSPRSIKLKIPFWASSSVIGGGVRWKPREHSILTFITHT